MTIVATTSRLLRLLGHLLSALLLVTVCAGALALLVVPMMTGAKPLTVLTGSMTGTYDPGDVVVVRPVDPSELQVGDTVTFQSASDRPEVVTHRIVGIGFRPDGTRQFITQGDANQAPDEEPVVAGQVRGTVWYSVPWVGYASTAFDPGQREIAIEVLAAALIAYGLYLFARGLLDRRQAAATRSTNVTADPEAGFRVPGRG